jgi:DNA-directed RNA polymerase sigma subunit (sigma70/sigma32)
MATTMFSGNDEQANAFLAQISQQMTQQFANQSQQISQQFANQSQQIQQISQAQQAHFSLAQQAYNNQVGFNAHFLARLNQMNRDQVSQQSHLSRIDGTLRRINERLDTHSQRLDGIGDRLDTHSQRLDGIGDRLDVLQDMAASTRSWASSTRSCVT